MPEHKRFSIQAVSVIKQPSDTFDSSDPFRKEHPAEKSNYRPKLIPVSPLRVVQDAPVDPNLIPPSPPGTRPSSPSTITPSLAVSSTGLNPIRKGLQRLKTLTRARSILPPRRVASDPGRIPAAQPTSSTPQPHFLPELSFDTTPFLDFSPFERVSDYPATGAERHETQPVSLPPVSPTSPEGSRLTFPLIKWERVDPKTLTPSPYAPPTTDISPYETPLLVPSPSWLSRNTVGIEPRLVHNSNPLIEVTPPSPSSPAPLPILPRSLLPVPSRHSVPPSPVTPRIEVSLDSHQ